LDEDKIAIKAINGSFVIRSTQRIFSYFGEADCFKNSDIVFQSNEVQDKLLSVLKSQLNKKTRFFVLSTESRTEQTSEICNGF